MHRQDPKAVVVDDALAPVFRLYQSNRELSQVLLKVAALNSLYSTSIYSVLEVAKKIVECEIDAMVSAGDPETVSLIRTVSYGGRERNNYSFATKYCWWHNHAEYPIYDSKIDDALWHYMRHHPFSTYKLRYELREYPKFKQTIFEFKEYFQLQDFTVRDIDNFLFFAGELDA